MNLGLDRTVVNRAGLIYVLVGGLLLLTAACHREDPIPPEAIFRLNGDWTYWETFEGSVERIHGESIGGLSDRVLTAMLDEYLNEEHLRLWAQTEKISVRSSGLLQAILDHEMREEVVQDHEVAEFYRQHLEEFQEPERLHLRQIVVVDRPAAEEVQARLDGGVPFELVADEFDVAGSMGPGGDQGILRCDELPDIFEEAVMALKPGEISAPRKAPHGYHFFQVVRRLPPETLALEDVTRQIRERLLGSKADLLIEDIIQQARGRWPVEVVTSNLPFEYTGAHGVYE